MKRSKCFLIALLSMSTFFAYAITIDAQEMHKPSVNDFWHALTQREYQKALDLYDQLHEAITVTDDQLIKLRMQTATTDSYSSSVCNFFANPTAQLAGKTISWGAIGFGIYNLFQAIPTALSLKTQLQKKTLDFNELEQKNESKLLAKEDVKHILDVKNNFVAFSHKSAATIESSPHFPPHYFLTQILINLSFAGASLLATAGGKLLINKIYHHYSEKNALATLIERIDQHNRFRR